jgi:hypothetical protein
MRREIWGFLANGQQNVVRSWMEDEKLTQSEQAKLDFALNRLKNLDFQLLSQKFMAGPLRGTKIYKLRLSCSDRQLRPMLCRGPVQNPLDYTLLHGAEEVGDRLHPGDAAERADRNRRTLIDNPRWRELF